jgi:hypothetical protein
MTDAMTRGTSTETCLYIYAIADATEPVALPGAELRQVSVGRIGAVCSDFDPEQLSDGSTPARDGWLAALARRHDGVVRELSARRAVLPVRLGTLCADEGRLRAALRGSESGLTAQLDAVRGRMEWTVRVEPEVPITPGDEPSDATDGTGADYLTARRGEYRRRAALQCALRDTAAALDRRLRALACDSAARATARPGCPLARSYLVPTAAQYALRCALVDAEARLAGVGARLDVTGPLPPYSFVDVRLEVRS